MKSALFILPNQLFTLTAGEIPTKNIFLIEHPRFFKSFKFHKNKLILHRASMKCYEKELRKQDYHVRYIDVKKVDLHEIIKKEAVKKILAFDPVDSCIKHEFEKLSKQDISLNFIRNPGFLTEADFIHAFFEKKDHYSMKPFYLQQRKRFNILLDDDKPAGGKWTYDTDNRKKLPVNLTVPEIPVFKKQSELKKAVDYVHRLFPDNPDSSHSFIYPINRKQAEKWLHSFLHERLKNFGPYEDAISRNRAFLFHSILTPVMNIGLFTPDEVIIKTLEFAKNHNVPLNSLEGFIRQIIGWREFVRAVYLLKADSQKTANYCNFKKPLPDAFYTASTGIEPVDIVIKRVNDISYCHHIERLMILGNFMLLCEIHPNQVYRWFMELFIDAYDWVMVPNVYGMSQYADGGLMTTKPYISSSNYILKMSHYKRAKWCEIWDGLFWRFINKYSRLFAANPRMKIMIRQLEKMDKNKLQKHIKTAEDYLEKLFKCK